MLPICLLHRKAVLMGRAAAIVLPVLVLVLFAPLAHAGSCQATGSDELTPAEVYEARMTAKAESGAFEFGSGSMEAAKVCAELVNRISSMSLANVTIPTTDEVLEAIKEAAAETVDEACRYVATTSTNWVRSQTSYARQTANSTASKLLKANVNVSNPNTSSVIATYRSRLRQQLPTYSDLPSLRDLD